MKTTQDIPVHQRYLVAIQLMSADAIQRCKEATQRLLDRMAINSPSQPSTQVLEFLNWEPQQNQFALLTSYAYADLQIPCQFDCLFDVRDPHNSESCELTIIQSVFEGYYPIKGIEHGHKHLLICRSENGTLPHLIQKLLVATDLGYEATPNSFRMGICLLSDYPMIANGLMQDL